MLTVALFLMVLGPYGNAEQVPEVITTPVTAEVLATTQVAKIQPELLNYIENQGIDIHPEDELKAVAIEEDGSDDELVLLQVLQHSGNSYTTHTFYSFDADGKKVNAPITVSKQSTRASYFEDFQWTHGWTGAITIVGSALYDMEPMILPNGLTRTYMYPRGLSFVYNYTSGYVPVSNIKMNFGIFGPRYNANDIFIEYDYRNWNVVVINKTNPVAGWNYSATGGLPSSVKVSNESDASGMYVAIEATVNGTYDDTRWTVYP